MMDKQAAREKAWADYRIKHKLKNFVDGGFFLAGFDAGYEAAGRWHRISSVEDLPKVPNKTVNIAYTHVSNPGVVEYDSAQQDKYHDWYWTDGSLIRDDFQIIAWAEILTFTEQEAR